MTETRKALVAFDPDDPQKRSSDFLITHRYGMVVLTNWPTSANDLFAKIVEARLVVPDVDEALSTLSRFVAEMGRVKVGNIVEVVQSEEGFALVLVGKSPSGFGKGAT